MPTSYRAAQAMIKRGDETALRAALDSGLDPNLKNENGWSLLMLAAVEGSQALAELLLQRGALVESRNSHDETALSLAAQRGQIPLLKLLLHHGAGKDCKPHGSTLSAWLTGSVSLTEPQLAEVLQLLGI